MFVYIEERLCKGCGLCVHFCPRGVLGMSERRNEKGYNVVEVIHPEQCKPCKLCEMNCPDFALCVVKEEG
jgi:2-oxoglutarate ferredoxin oxidoreductase subunit delta